MSTSSSILKCAQQSVGPGNTIASTLIQTLLTAYCAISSPEIWPRDYGPTALRYGLDTYDFIVVGAGSAGSVMASRLSENPNWKILVLEAGGDPPVESEIPGLFFTIEHTEYNWNYFTEADGKSCKGFRDEKCYWPRGKMIGGTGGINGMLYVRGNREDYDNWERMGNPYWGWEDVYPYFEKSVQLGRNSSWDERGGTIVNHFGRDYPEIRKMIFSGAEEMGLPHVSTIDEGQDIGYTEIPGTLEDGRRASTGKTYLAKARYRPNLHVIKNAVATKIVINKDNSVAGVRFSYMNAYDFEVKVSKEVIVSAGALDSPKLLMLSGIGPYNHLKLLDIDFIKDLRVGDNLLDHLGLPIFIKIDKSKLKRETLKDKLDASYNYLVNQTGPLAGHGTVAVVGLVNTDPKSSSPYPDIVFHHLFMQSGSSNLDIWINATLLSEDIAQGVQQINQNDHVLIVYIVLLRPKSIGRMRLRSSDPKDPPKLFANYLESPDDIETLLRGIQFQMQIIKTAAFQEQGAEMIQINLPECDQFPFMGNEYWKCYMKYIGTTMYHMASTVRMGPDSEPCSVVDWRLRVKGIKGLRVADTSIMPYIMSGNTNAPTIMIAERAADFIKEEFNAL